MDEPTKRGNRNNTDDRKRIRNIRQCAKSIHDITLEMEPDDQDEVEITSLFPVVDKSAKAEGVIQLGTAIVELLTVKAAGDWQLDVLGIPFGSPTDRDSDRQYFDKSTNLFLQPNEETPVFYYHGLDPNGKPQGEPEQIGTAKFSRTDEQGHWFRVTLDKISEYAKRVWEAAKKGIARASSGAVAHLVRIDQDGHISTWPFAELSLFDAEGRRQPANQSAVVYVAKAQFHPQIEHQPEATGEGEQRPGAADNGTQKFKKEFIDMEKDELIKILDERDAAKAAADKAKAEEQARIDAAVKAAVDAAKKEWAEGNRLPVRQAPHVTQFNGVSKFDNYPAEDLSLAASVLKSQNKPVSEALINALALKSSKLDNTAAHGMYVQGKMKASGINLETIEKAVKDATDPMYSTLSSYGDEWVGAGYSNALWETIRAANQVVAKIPSITVPDGWESMTFPVESGDPTWYKVAQTTADNAVLQPTVAVTNSLVGSASASLTLAKMGARTMYTGELAEDSLISYAAQLRAQMAASGADAMENIVINGDTTTTGSTNINDIGGSTYSGAATSLFLFCEGFRYYPLVTGVATQGRSAGGGLVIEDYLETMKLLGTNGLGAADPSKINFIVDPNTHYANMKIAEVKTRDISSAATIENGFLTRAYAVGIIPSWQMHAKSTSRKANTAGKVDNDSTTNNAYGAILAVRWDQWKLGYKRQMTIESTRYASADSYEIVALARWGLAKRAAAGCSSITYYVGV